MADLLRNLTLVVPLAAALAAAVAARGGRLRRDRQALAAAGLATLWAFLGVLVVEASTDLWTFTAGPTSYVGIPMETALGWALAWGALPALIGGRPVLWLLGLAWVDVLVMPRLQPLVVLGDHWLLGEALLLGAVAAPAVLLGRATRDRSHLTLRVCLQLVAFTTLTFWLVPSLAFAADGTRWTAVVDHPLPVRTALLILAVGCLVPAAAAVAELARVGGGTPFPWDPPERLVVTGPYAYLANPMQAGASATLLLLALAAGSPALLLGVVVAVVFCLALAEPHERVTMASRWPEHRTYRAHVRAWRPRRRPWVPVPATLWVSRTCGICRATGASVARLAPVGLEIRPAEEAGVRLTRMRWAGPDVPPDRGVAALARALEQAHLVAAWWGWLIRLPVVRPVLQLVLDACGLGPRDVGPASPRTVRG